MSFESGSISFRAFRVTSPAPENVVACFAESAAPPADTIKNQVMGWVTGKHLLDRNITAEAAYCGGYLRLDLLTAERKIPAALLKAEVAMECRAQLAATGNAFLKGSERAEIRKSVTERLLPGAPLALRSIPMVWNTDCETLFAQALSPSACDRLTSQLLSTLGLQLGKALPALLTPDIAAQLLSDVGARDLPGANFSPDSNTMPEVDLGCEFLTWLWYANEADSALTPPYAALIEGPLTFIDPQSNGAQVTTLKNGLPTSSREACACLMAGKKLKSAKVTFVGKGEALFPCTLDAQEFTFRGLKLSVSKTNLDPVSRFQERMQLIEAFTDMFYDTYKFFLAIRTNEAEWTKTVALMRQWVRGRKGRD